MARRSRTWVRPKPVSCIGAAPRPTPVSLTVTTTQPDGMGLSDRVIGQIWNLGRSDADQHRYARHAILDQLTNNPNGGVVFQNGVLAGSPANALPLLPPADT